MHYIDRYWLINIDMSTVQSLTENNDKSVSVEMIMKQFEVELMRLEKERQSIVDEYLEALRKKKIEILKKNLAV